MAPARSFQDEKMDRNACDAVRIDSLRTETETRIRRMDGAFGSDIRKCRRRRNTCTDFNCRADRHTHSNPHRYAGTDRNTRADTHCYTCRYPRADSCPYAGTHGSADGRTCPGAGQYKLWCCAL